MTAAPDTATRLDRAIDALLRDEAPLPAADGDTELTATARLLRDVLPRFHPRFGFEELLAGRLVSLRRPASHEPIPFPGAVTGIEDAASAERRRRGLVAGGAIASGVSVAIPLAGAALVVWRRSRSSGGLF